MDGSFSWFPMADGSAVIGKRWNSDGTIQTVRYAPESTEPQQPVDADPELKKRMKADMVKLTQEMSV